MTRALRVVGLPLLTAGLSAAGFLGTVSASAETGVGDPGAVTMKPTHCLGDPERGRDGAFSALCWGGSGAYRATASCESSAGGSFTIVHGRWYTVQDPEWSIAQCPAAFPYMRTGWTETSG